MNVISAHKAKNYKSTEPGRVSKFSTKETMPWISAKALAATINPTRHVRRNGGCDTLICFLASTLGIF